MMIAKRRGFTLVELLVVIGIISILAAIVVPQAAGYFRRANATAALADIQGIDLALTTMLSDSGRNSLKHLFNSQNFRNYVYGGSPPDDNSGALNTLQMARAQELYTRTFYALLREGRAALDSERFDTELGINYKAVLDADVVKKLGSGYLDLANDPWGEKLYQIWPGPLPRPVVVNNSFTLNPVPFRTYQQSVENLPGSKQNPDDGLILNVFDEELGELLTIGYPASTKLTAYIYSYGENLLSGQGIADVLAAQAGRGIGTGIQWVEGQAREDFYEVQDPILMGGGDDVNNWDKGQSWMRFYR